MSALDQIIDAFEIDTIENDTSKDITDDVNDNIGNFEIGETEVITEDGERE